MATIQVGIQHWPNTMSMCLNRTRSIVRINRLHRPAKLTDPHVFTVLTTAVQVTGGPPEPEWLAPVTRGKHKHFHDLGKINHRKGMQAKCQAGKVDLHVSPSGD